MKIFLTGATGFVGRHTVDALLSAGHQVVALIRRQTPHQDLIDKGVVCFYGNLASFESSLPPDIDAVIHIAGLIKAKNLEDFYTVNVEGTRWLCEQFRNHSLRKFVLVSSIAARGPNQSADSDESAGPVSHYGKSKRAGEDQALSYSSSFPVTVIRPPIVYGPGDRETLLFFKMFRKGLIMMPGFFTRKNSFIYVEDLAHSLVESVNTEVGVYGVDDGKSGGYDWEEISVIAEQSLSLKKISVRHLPLFLAKIASYLTPLLDRDKYAELKCPYWFFLNSPLANKKPPTNLAEGFSKTYQWYLQQGWL